VKNYICIILIALSQLGNAILGGYPDESMSARAWRSAKQGGRRGGVLRPVIDAFFFVVTIGRDRNHCRDAYDSERSRRQFPEYYRRKA
jgi:hypothetical protein